MKCPKCQFENREGAKFCKECGNKLELACPQCGSAYTPGTKFCDECGHNLSVPSEPTPKDLSFDEKIDKIQRYLPKGLTEKILAQRGRIEGERKQVTVMFCDLEGFTPMVERLGPEDAYAIMDQVYEILIHKVHDYEGTVNEMTGDGVMALFGAPIALEDAPQRAIRSGLAIHREMARFSDKMKQERGGMPPIKMRIGIHTGPVVVGTLGNNLRVEFKAVGDTVNVASRMEGLAEPGTTFVSGETFMQTEGLFRFEALGEKDVKGKEEPLKIYRVIAASTRRTRFDVSAERGLTPFVGRQRDLELLLDGLERAKAGHGQACSIISEAGLGKSRLLYEFRKAISNEDLTFLMGKCVSYGRGLSYHPITDILKSNFDIEEEDKDATVQNKVRSGLVTLGAEEPSILPYILEVLSVRDSGIDKIMMSPEGKKDQIIETLKHIVIKGSQIRPLVLAVEDLHWTDISSEDVLRALVPAIPGARVFLVFTYRPEFLPAWGVKSYQSQITLNRLSNRESIHMAEYLLGSKRISPSLEGLILEKGEGVPFFVEEFVKSLELLKIIEKDESICRLTKDSQSIQIPSTIQDVIMARVDALPEAAKDVLQIASVVEREFSDELIKCIAGLQEQELLSCLSILKDSELIFEKGLSPHLTYVFKHALTRDVISDSILTNRRRELHNKIGNAMEKIYHDNLDEYCGILANHFMEAEDYSKAAEYSKLAAKKAQRTGALKDAIGYGEKLVTSLERLPRTDSVVKKIVDASTTLGLYYNQTNNFVLSREAVEPVVDLAAKHDYRRRIAQINTILGAYAYAVEEDFPKASKLLLEAINTAEATGDLISLVMANHWMGHVLADNCEFERSLYHLDKGLQINTMANVLWGISAHKSCIARTVYLFQGKVNVGYPMSLEGLQTAEESGDTYSKAEAHISMGTACLQRRQLEDAENHLSLGCGLCERFGFTALHSLAEGTLAETHFSMEKYGESKNNYANTLQILNSNTLYPSWVCVNELCVARAMVMNYEKIANLDVLLTYADRNRIKLADGKIRRVLAEILLYSDAPQLSDAEKWIHEALVADRQNGLLFELARDLIVFGEIYKRKNDHSKAREAVGEAISVFQECGADGWVKKYEEEIALLS
jgi:class 3 adenylate cyclase/tetratricopeptide (TPR) repeat protein